MKWLVKFADNWADEMDVEGFAIYFNMAMVDKLAGRENRRSKLHSIYDSIQTAL